MDKRIWRILLTAVLFTLTGCAYYDAPQDDVVFRQVSCGTPGSFTATPPSTSDGGEITSGQSGAATQNSPPRCLLPTRVYARAYNPSVYYGSHYGFGEPYGHTMGFLPGYDRYHTGSLWSLSIGPSVNRGHALGHMGGRGHF